MFGLQQCWGINCSYIRINCEHFEKCQISPCCQAAKPKRTHKKPTHSKAAFAKLDTDQDGEVDRYRDRFIFSMRIFSAQNFFMIWLFEALHPPKFNRHSPEKAWMVGRRSFLSFWGRQLFSGASWKISGVHQNEKAKNTIRGNFRFQR